MGAHSWKGVWTFHSHFATPIPHAIFISFFISFFHFFFSRVRMSSLKRKRSFLDGGLVKRQARASEELLPYDLWLLVFESLPVEDLVNSIPLTCSFFSRIVRDPSLWKKLWKQLAVQFFLNGDQTLIATKERGVVTLAEFGFLWTEEGWKERFLSLYSTQVGLILAESPLKDKITFSLRQDHSSLCCQRTHASRSCRHPEWSWPSPKCRCPFSKKHSLLFKRRKDQKIEFEELGRVCELLRTITRLDSLKFTGGTLQLIPTLGEIYQYTQSCTPLDSLLRQGYGMFCMGGSLYLRFEDIFGECIVDDSIRLLAVGVELQMCHVCDYVTPWEVLVQGPNVHSRQKHRKTQDFVEFRHLGGGTVLRTKPDPRRSILGSLFRLFKERYFVYPRLFVASMTPLVFRIEIFFRVDDQMPQSPDFLNLINQTEI